MDRGGEMSDVPLFVAFRKIPRLSREVILTEKIDGTNGVVHVHDDGTVRAGSRNRWITPEADNFGFAKWVKEHEDELRTLGPGYHFGEWWGKGIQRGYGLTEKRWSLFNASKWNEASPPPACCTVVPVLWSGPFETGIVHLVLSQLEASGSKAAPGFMKPEGVVVYHVAGGIYFKKTIGDDGAKERTNAA
jgi:hypothetical protein